MYTLFSNYFAVSQKEKIKLLIKNKLCLFYKRFNEKLKGMSKTCIDKKKWINVLKFKNGYNFSQ